MRAIPVLANSRTSIRTQRRSMMHVHRHTFVFVESKINSRRKFAAAFRIFRLKLCMHCRVKYGNHTETAHIHRAGTLNPKLIIEQI